MKMSFDPGFLDIKNDIETQLVLTVPNRLMRFATPRNALSLGPGPLNALRDPSKRIKRFCVRKTRCVSMSFSLSKYPEWEALVNIKTHCRHQKFGV